MAEPVDILLIDDEARNLDALEVLLNDPSYVNHRATNAEAALRTLLSRDVAAIVLDVRMPDVNGFELARLIRGTRRYRQIPILFVTAHVPEEEDLVEAYDAGALDYLVKPVNPRVLRLKIHAFAEQFRMRRALEALNQNLEARVHERTEELRSAAEQKDRFLATLAHELRNPLGPLRIGLDVLTREPNPSPEASRTLSVMKRQLGHMVRLIDDLLDVSRISGGKLDLRLGHVSLATVVATAVETAEPNAAVLQQRIEVAALPDVQLHVDPTRIAQIIANLLNNACKHSPAGALVRMDAAQTPAAVQVRVIDEGVGIPTAQLERVFDMFTKIPRSTVAANDGLGIGLALSRHLAELHGGSLAAWSAGEGAGATFTLTLPCTTMPEVELDRPPADPSTKHESEAPLRIVLVEDNADAADLLSGWLQRRGHEVHVGRTGGEGIALVVAVKPDLVLCDVGLPDMDGYEVCRRIVTELVSPPFMVALTGWGMQADRVKSRDAGFREHLVKPVAIETLLSILGAVPRAPLA